MTAANARIASPSFRPLKAPGSAHAGPPLLDPAGPRAVLGWRAGDLAGALSPAADTLFGPRGVCLPPGGGLWAADTGHHRVLGWRTLPERDNAPADVVIGQPDFASEGRNGRGDPGPATLNVPTGICAFREGLAVADAWNHRVLIWRELPGESGQPANIVLGQAEMGAVLANRGADRPGADTLNWPYGVAAVAGGLAVCDTGNRRVLWWADPVESGQPADRVLGQNGFDSRDENAGGPVSAMSMRWPHALAEWNGALAVADAGNNRVMIWSGGLPEAAGAPCEAVLGQEDFTACDHNMGSYYPDARALNMPYALAVSGGVLLVADTANSRLLGWERAAMAAPAARLTGQPDFASKGDNGWGLPRRDSLCWPYGLSARDGLVAVADSGNNRVLLWPVAE